MPNYLLLFFPPRSVALHYCFTWHFLFYVTKNIKMNFYFKLKNILII